MKILNVIQTSPVKAEKANDREMLKIQGDNDFLITITAAEQDDLKITFNEGYQIFINDQFFQNFYEANLNLKQNDYFISKPRIGKAVEVTKNIRFFNTAGYLEYAQKGDFIVFLNNQFIHVFPKQVFHSNYRTATLQETLAWQTQEHIDYLSEIGLGERAKGIKLREFDSKENLGEINLTPFNKRMAIPKEVLQFEIKARNGYLL